VEEMTSVREKFNVVDLELGELPKLRMPNGVFLYPPEFLLHVQSDTEENANARLLELEDILIRRYPKYSDDPNLTAYVSMRARDVFNSGKEVFAHEYLSMLFFNAMEAWIVTDRTTIIKATPNAKGHWVEQPQQG
jgi:hypothetical protein